MKALLAAQKEKGVQIGPLSSRPKLELGDETYMEFFYTLNRSRGMTDMGGPQHISIVDMEALLRLWGIDQRDHRLKYVRIAQNLDSIYLDHIAEKRESASRQKEK